MRIDVSVIINYIVSYACYLIIIIASVLIAYPLIKPLFKRRTNYGRLKKNKFTKTRIFKHINSILSVVANMDSDMSVYLFFMIVLLLFSFSLKFFVLVGQKSSLGITLSALIASTPYIVLRIKLYTMQAESSYEGEELVSELINQYRINSFNMKGAISRTCSNLKNSPYSHKALVRLAMILPKYRTDDELTEQIQKFVFSIGTEWAALLGNCITGALLTEERVDNALDDILKDLKDLNKISSFNKKINHETFTVVRVIIPTLYIASLYALYKWVGLSKAGYIELQFKSALGFKCFALIVVSMIINYVVCLIIKRPKNDF